MTINGLDISLWQEYDWQFINWPLLKADPKNFRFIWIKCQEGSLLPTDAGSYSIAIVKRQIAGARSVGFEAINLYHFYWYQLQQKINGVWTWVPLSAEDEARAFYEMYKLTGLTIAHPMTDCEDPLIRQFLTFTDTAGANRALSFARKLNTHLRQYHEAVTRMFGVKPDIYSGKWWLDMWVPMLKFYYPAEVDWLKDYQFILADYDGTFTLPSYLSMDQVIAWQETSTPKPPIQGIPTGQKIPGDALDIDRWMKTDADFLAWAKIEQPPQEGPTDKEKLDLVYAWYKETHA